MADESDKDQRDMTSLGNLAAPDVGKLPKPDSQTSGAGAVAPPILPAATPPESSADHTVHGNMLPPVIPPRLPDSPVAKGIGGAISIEEHDEESGSETVILPTKVRTQVLELQRVEPPGHLGSVRLERSEYVVGRSKKEGCDILLFSGTASRRHAKLQRQSDGWYLSPIEDKPVIANGDLVKGSIRLTHKMRLRLGGDELVVFDPSMPVQAAASSSPKPAVPGSRLWLWVGVVVFAAAVLVGLWSMWK
jgi:hypothetical protein